MATELKKILVVDDEVQIRDLLSRLLSKKGYQAVTLPSGATALEFLKKDRPDLIILDQNMPEMDGLETLKKIREFDRETPIVMLTGYATEELKITALKHGANDFLMKGIPTEQFLKSVEGILERQERFTRKKGGRGGKVMVVDDEPDVRKLLEKYLTRHGYEVRTASSGEEALEILKSADYEPEVVLLDIGLTGIDGLTVLKEIKELNKEITVLVLTGADEKALRQQALELGALEYFTKPIKLDHIELTIRIRGLGRLFDL